VRHQQTAVQKQPEKWEVFVDDKKVLVVPGTTVLQVRRKPFGFGRLSSLR